jgi:hypothetical protein
MNEIRRGTLREPVAQNPGVKLHCRGVHWAFAGIGVKTRVQAASLAVASRRKHTGQKAVEEIVHSVRLGRYSSILLLCSQAAAADLASLPLIRCSCPNEFAVFHLLKTSETLWKRGCVTFHITAQQTRGSALVAPFFGEMLLENSGRLLAVWLCPRPIRILTW